MQFNFQDIFKSSFLENINTIPIFDLVLTMVLSFALGMFIFFIYKKCYAGVMYSSTFGVTLIALTMISAFLILAVASNIVLSLGMVGALSIVRFRTAIKEPSDIAFLFWVIAVGIVLATGLIPFAVFGSLLIGIVLTIFSPNKKVLDKPYILVVHCDNSENEEKVREFVTDRVKKMSLKSKSVAQGCIELNYEVRLKDADTTFINELATLTGVTHTVMVSYNGDYMC